MLKLGGGGAAQSIMLKPWQIPFYQISHLKDMYSEQRFNLPFVCNDLASIYLSSLKIKGYPENLYSTY